MIRVNIDSISDLTTRQKTIKSNLNQVKSNITSHKNGLDFEISKRSSVLNSYNNLYSKLSNITNDLEQLESVLNLAVIQYSTAETKVQTYMKNTFGNISDKNVGDICIKENDKNSNKKSSLLEGILDFGKGVINLVDKAIEYSGNVLGQFVKTCGAGMGIIGITFKERNGKVLIYGTHDSKLKAGIKAATTRINKENMSKYPILNKIYKTDKVLKKIDNFVEGPLDKLGYVFGVIKGAGEIFSEDNKGKDIAHVTTDVVIESAYNVGNIVVSSAVSKGTIAGGVKLGTAIGTFICPGVGTAVGATIGAGVGFLAGIGVSKFMDWIVERDPDGNGKGVKDDIKDVAANFVSSFFKKGNGNGKLNLAR